MKKKILWKKEFYIKRKLFTLNKSPYSEEEEKSTCSEHFPCGQNVEKSHFLERISTFPRFSIHYHFDFHVTLLGVEVVRKPKEALPKSEVWCLLSASYANWCQVLQPACRWKLLCFAFTCGLSVHASQLLIYELLRCHQTSCQKELSCANATPARKYSHPSDCQAKCHGAHSVISNH